MEYKKTIKTLDYTTNQPPKFRTKSWVEINDESWGKYNTCSIKIKASTINLYLCDHIDAYILASGTITVTIERDNKAKK